VDTLRVLGIDPGSQITGYGVVEQERARYRQVVYGEIRPGRGVGLSDCLQKVYEGLREAITVSAPDAVAIEDIFYGKNVRSLIRQAHVRGTAILAARHCAVPVFEYAPLEIKKAVVGYGRAEKSQVQAMVRAILALKELPPPDAADALAVALCHLNFMKTDPL